jgi:hypothetical protein
MTQIDVTPPLPDVNDGNWHGHNQTVMPVHPDTIVKVLYSTRDSDTAAARKFSWLGYSGAFRVVKQYKEAEAAPAGERWIVGTMALSEAGAKEYADRFGGDIIHMREVKT